MAHVAGTVSGLETGPIQSGPVRINKGYVYLLSAIAALGGILFGFDLVIISGLSVSFRRTSG
jgi:SP family arabinose:H+ symporter-like MFS transporter